MKSEKSRIIKKDRNQQLKIGVFDSGVGANLVSAAIQRKITDANIIIKTDPKYFPYGNRSSNIIQQRLVHFAKEFQKEGCQIVVIACNSATTNGMASLRRKFPELLFIGIEPPVKPIVKMTKTGKVAVIGTDATIRSKQLKRLIERYGNGVTIYVISCPRLAEIVEKVIARSLRRGNLNSRQIATVAQGDLATTGASSLIKKFLDQPISDGVDVIGLACTHYPYVLPLMKKLYPSVTFYDPTEAVVDRVKQLVSSRV